jgi:hypothetical protein
MVLRYSRAKSAPMRTSCKTPKGASTLLILVLRLVCLRKCGRFHEPEPKQRDQPEPCARAVRCSVGRAVCTHRQQSPLVSAARTVWMYHKKDRRDSTKLNKGQDGGYHDKIFPIRILRTIWERSVRRPVE